MRRIGKDEEELADLVGIYFAANDIRPIIALLALMKCAKNSGKFFVLFRLARN